MLPLSHFVRCVYAPAFLYGQRKFCTISEYVTSVEYYLRIVGDPPLDQINPLLNAKFLNGLKTQGLANETIRKHCRHLNAIFAKAGPPGPRIRDALGLLHHAPWVKPPQTYKKLPREIRDCDVDALYHAVDHCAYCFKYPTCLDEKLIRPLWWKALLTLVTTTAIRKKVVFGLQWADFGPGNKYFIVDSSLDKSEKSRGLRLSRAGSPACRDARRRGHREEFGASEDIPPPPFRRDIEQVVPHPFG